MFLRWLTQENPTSLTLTIWTGRPTTILRQLIWQANCQMFTLQSIWLSFLKTLVTTKLSKFVRCIQELSEQSLEDICLKENGSCSFYWEHFTHFCICSLNHHGGELKLVCIAAFVHSLNFKTVSTTQTQQSRQKCSTPTGKEKPKNFMSGVNKQSSHIFDKNKSFI